MNVQVQGETKQDKHNRAAHGGDEQFHYDCSDCLVFLGIKSMHPKFIEPPEGFDYPSWKRGEDK
jgi:hypothetical protein